MNIDLVQVAEQSWLYFIKQALDALDQPFVFEVDQQRFSNGETVNTADDDYLIIAPQISWTPGNDPESINLEFLVGARTVQKPGATLVSHRKNRELQTLIDSILFAPEREAVGSMADVRVYYIPLQSFDADGEPLSVIDDQRLEYVRGTWRNQQPGAPAQEVIWATTIQARVI